MYKKNLYILFGAAALLTFSGCMCSAQTVKAEETEEFIMLDEDMEEDEESDTIEPFNPSDYLIANIDEYITLGEIKGIPATEYVYTVTDEMVEAEINSELEFGAEEEEVDRPAQAGDTIYLDLVSTIEGQDPAEPENTYFLLGEEEYGADFDAALMGLSAGDTKTFDITFDDQIWIDEWVDQTVTFDVTVSSVAKVNVPELTDEYVKENTDFDTVEEYRASVREYVESDNATSSQAETMDSLFAAVEAQTEFLGYPQEMYDNMKDELLSFYSMFTGSNEISDLLDSFGITEDDFNEEVLTSVNHRLIVSAICQKNDIELTFDAYTDFLQEYADYYGYDSIAEFEEENDRESLIWTLYENLAGEFLYDNAELTQEEAQNASVYSDDMLEEYTDEELEDLLNSEMLDFEEQE